MNNGKKFFSWVFLFLSGCLVFAVILNLIRHDDNVNQPNVPVQNNHGQSFVVCGSVGEWMIENKDKKIISIFPYGSEYRHGILYESKKPIEKVAKKTKGD